jgi:hypothetical protein
MKGEGCYGQTGTDITLDVFELWKVSSVAQQFVKHR